MNHTAAQLSELVSAPRVFESESAYTPLGIRFWDPVCDKQVTHGLNVYAYPAVKPGTIVKALKTWSGNFAFHKLPGLAAVLPGDAAASPPETKPFVVVAADPQGRFFPAAFLVNAPRAGLMPSGLPQTSPSTAINGLALSSAPGRQVPRWYAQIRGKLYDQSTGQPAAYAVVAVSVAGGGEFTGLSGPSGEFVVLMPYPTTPQPFNVSPATSGGTDLLSQTWDVIVRIRYAPIQVTIFTELNLPDYLTVLTQADAEFIAGQSGTGVATLPAVLTVNELLTMHTDGDEERRLWIRPLVF